MEKLKEILTSQYGFEHDFYIKKFDAGFLSDNYIIEFKDKKFFLKGYRFKDKANVSEVHAVKFFFASKGIPVILPVKTKVGDTIFSLDDKHYALFPFVVGIHYNRGTIPRPIGKALGEFLARMHQVGKEYDFPVKAGFKSKSKATVIFRIKEILNIIESKHKRDAFDTLAFETLSLKLELVNRDSRPVEEFICEPLILLQGDFHEQNIFFDGAGAITCIFDFEKAQMGPRSFELWRSANYMFLNGYFSEGRINDVIAYISAYNAVNPISKDELARGLEIYYQKCIHSVWVEQEHYLKNNSKTDMFLENRTIKYLSQNKSVFLETIVSCVYTK